VSESSTAFDRAVRTPTWTDRLSYRIVRDLLVAFGRVYFRATYEGLEHVPAGGPFVLAANHRSNVDFFLCAGVARRRIRYMGKEELWKSRLLGGFISALGAFPVHRGKADREAMRRCIKMLQQGEPLVLFPEGTRRHGPKIEDLHDGTAYIAMKTGVPIIPVAVGGTERAMARGQILPRPVKVHILIGPPILPPPLPEDGRRPSRRALKELTDLLRAEMQRLFDEAQKKAGVDPSPGSAV
jgi:1-acyl-sn-glycerol-3-phosphate acyltransferase